MAYSLRSHYTADRNLVAPHPQFDEVRFIATEIQEWFFDEFYELQGNISADFLCLQWTTS